MSKTYVTSAGDIWDTIAKAQLGGERYMTVLAEANPRHINTVIFPAGIKMTIPDITTPIPSTLPPWKQVK